ncbi:hypothetical protein JI752_001345 [Lysobacter sp. MMG2]|uniref:hypothetical protein n=1 Tax=Lysobacter sp. MMG2 TaxID=2801338 RepID=UPI001C21D129|nr:hypothetical protein [Lysobacter sp. MMG2]MBU8974776.1 hypothetical protein [Lysobacter sp. MMG2]
MSSRTSTITETAYIRLRGWGFSQVRAATLCKSEAELQATGALGKQARARLEATVRGQAAAGTVEARPNNYGADALGQVRFNYLSDATLRHYAGVGPATSEVEKYVSRAAKEKVGAKAAYQRALHCSELGSSEARQNAPSVPPRAKATLAEHARLADLSFEHSVRLRETVGPRQLPLGVLLTDAYQAKLETLWDRRHVKARAIFEKENSTEISPTARARLLERAYRRVLVDEYKLDPRQRQRRASEIAKRTDHYAGDPRWRAHCTTPELRGSRSELPDPDKVTAKVKGKPGRPRKKDERPSTNARPHEAHTQVHPLLAEEFVPTEFDMDDYSAISGLAEEEEGDNEEDEVNAASAPDFDIFDHMSVAEFEAFYSEHESD